MNTDYSLADLGWRKFFSKQLNNSNKHLIPARVCRPDLNRYQLLSEDGPLIGVLPGRSRQELAGDLPCVGDWVLCAPADESHPENVVIEVTLERFSKFSRKEAGERNREQIVAANIDTVFIVTGLDDNFNPARIERYLFLAWHSGATPVIVLSKADICDDIDERLAALAPVAQATPIHVVSGLSGAGLAQLAGYVTEGNTVALMGSSGVGKSTIINALLGYDRFDTGAVRENDSKGRHTTTFRELCKMEQGGMLIDTPGMREIQIWADDPSLAASFGDIDELALACRFNDCGHVSEPGCAVLAAIDAGTLDASRLDSHRKFRQELQHFAARQDANVRAERKKGARKFARSLKQRPDKRDET